MSEADAAPDAGPPDSDVVVRTRGLTKRFRSGQVAVDAIDLVVPRGAVFGFLGPNGSGKTTTLRMLLGLVGATAGQASVLGAEIPRQAASVLPRVGALVEGPAFQPYLTGRANLQRLDAVDATADRGTSGPRIAQALERVGLSAAAGKTYRQYSLGMKQRLGLAAALLRPRELLVLDEPTNGLDPQGTREVRHLIRDVAQEGATVLVSSHLLSEIELACSHLGVMSQGRLLVQGTRDEVMGGYASRLQVTTRPERLEEAVAALADRGLTCTDDGEGVVNVALEDGGDVAPDDVAPVLVAAGIPVLGLQWVRPTLEDVFVELTGHGFDVSG